MEETMKSIIMSLVLFMGLIGLYGANYSVQFDIDELSTEVNSRAFHEFKLVNCSSTRELGYPKLPCRVVSYIIPANLEVNNLSISATTTFLSGTYTIMPVQTPNLIMGTTMILLLQIRSCTTAILSTRSRVHKSFHIRIWMVRTTLLVYY